MGARSFLTLVACQYSLWSVRQPSKLAAAEVHDIDHARQAHDAHHAQLAEEGLLGSFHVDVAERLQQLRLHGAHNAHLNWLVDALASTVSTLSSLQLALTRAPASTSAASAASLVKHRADEVLSMLDVCTALKQVADDMDRQSGNLQHALQSVGQALSSEKAPFSSGRLRAAAHRLSACLMQDRTRTNMLCLTEKGNRPLAEAHSLLLATKRKLQSATIQDSAATLLSQQTLDGAMLTSLLALAFSVCSLSPPLCRKSSGAATSASKFISKYSSAKSLSIPWAAPLRQLHRDLRQEQRSGLGGALFQELQSLHSATAKVHAIISTPGIDLIQLAAVKQSVERLRKSLQEAQDCIAMFRMQITSFFQALIALRLALLDC